MARQEIAKAMLEIEDKTAIGDKKCIRFIPYKKIPIVENWGKPSMFKENQKWAVGNREDYLYIRPSKKCKNEGNCCSSSAGKVEQIGRQKVLLDHSCMEMRTILHELLHALGLFHEQSRSDRDKYVEIIEENIIDGKHDQFSKREYVPPMVKGYYNKDGVANLTNYDYYKFHEPMTKYDFESIMHYPADAFIKDNAKTRYTIVPKDKKLANNPTFMKKLGYNEHLSKNDIEQIRYLYKCYLKDF